MGQVLFGRCQMVGNRPGLLAAGGFAAGREQVAAEVGERRPFVVQLEAGHAAGALDHLGDGGLLFGCEFVFFLEADPVRAPVEIIAGVGEGDQRQLLDDALGAGPRSLGLGLPASFDGLRHLRDPEQPPGLLLGASLAVAGALGGLGAVEVDQVFIDESLLLGRQFGHGWDKEKTGGRAKKKPRRPASRRRQRGNTNPIITRPIYKPPRFVNMLCSFPAATLPQAVPGMAIP